MVTQEEAEIFARNLAAKGLVTMGSPLKRSIDEISQEYHDDDSGGGYLPFDETAQDDLPLGQYDEEYSQYQNSNASTSDENETFFGSSLLKTITSKKFKFDGFQSFLE